MSGENAKVYLPQGADRLAVSAGGYIKRSVAAPAAAGNSQGTGTALVSEVNTVTAADDTKGVVLPTAEAGMEITVINTVANKILKVYPASGGTINALQADAAISQAAASSARYIASSATQWYSVPTVPS